VTGYTTASREILIGFMVNMADFDQKMKNVKKIKKIRLSA